MSLINRTANTISYFSKEEQQTRGEGFRHKGKEYVHHSALNYQEIAYKRLSETQSILILTLFAALLTFLYIDWKITVITFISLLTIIYFLDLLFNLYLIFRGESDKPDIKVSQNEIINFDEEWPTYTILCPLYKESSVIKQFVHSIERLEYPTEKLQVILLLEEDDSESIEKTKSMFLPSNFELVVVPHSNPKTKPKACNYGLKKARGKYIVIYDAEDMPSANQLKKAVIAFRDSQENIVCIQAKLNFYNTDQNLLTKMFTAEYSVWFDLILTGLQAVNAPLPLGGTSNHFKTIALREIGGWDSFNVTEDCDLGVRLAKFGLKTSVLDSTTWEEANSNPFNWYRQRTRWIKGYIQTYFVHMRSPNDFVKNNNWLQFLMFQLTVGGKVTSILINPILWFITIIYFMFRADVGASISSFFPPAIFYIGVVSFIFGNFLYMYYYMVGCAKRNKYELIKYVLLTPFYWLGMSVAAYAAIVHFIFKPHHWSKTIHGLHLKQLDEKLVYKFQ